MDQISEQHSGAAPAKGGFLAMTLARLPRIAGVTVLAMVLAFVGVHMQPTQYKASLELPLATGHEANAEIEHILDPVQLADSVSRLPDATILELRRQDNGTLDSTALLRRQLILTPADNGGHLRLEAIAASAEHARAIVGAVAASYRNVQQVLPEALPATSDAAPAPAEPQPQPVARIGTTDTGLLQQRLTLAWENRIRLEEKAARIETLIAAGNFSSLALQAEGLPALGRRLDELATLETEREKLAVTLLPNHPTMRTLSEQIALVSGEVSQKAMELATLARADSDAALRLETGLRAEYDAQLASVAVDTSVLTGSIDTSFTTEVTPLPRPIGPGWALGLAGGMAFFGQLGLIALQQPRHRQLPGALFDSTEAAFAPAPPLEDPLAAHRQVHIPEPVHQPVVVPAPAERPPPVPAAHNWLGEPSSPPVVAIGAHWMGSDPAMPAQAPQADDGPQRPAPAKAQADSLAGLDSARIVAIRSSGSHGDTRAWARDLLDAYAEEGRRVVLIDAASRRRGAAPGISDLSLGRATFADIVHGTGRNEAALIPWGRQDTLYASARQVRTLLLALVELYDVVVITLDADASGSSHLADMADFVLAATPRPDMARQRRRVGEWR